MRTFDVPKHYRSKLITTLKQKRREADRMKKDFEPSVLDFGPIEIILARHFGFCYGVENAIEIAFRAVFENPDKRVFLLSEMIHNPQVNKDLKAEGVRFIMDTDGTQIIPWEEITDDDIVIIPAFGTTLEIEDTLIQKNIQPKQYNTTCPFVQKVWNRSKSIGDEGYTVIVHGKPKHEETRATFSHAQDHTATVIVRDMEQTQRLAKFITGELPSEDFYKEFEGQYSEGFDAEKDLEKIGVVNQTTMLASDTQGIADYLKEVMINHYQLAAEDIKKHFADTRDTLCYATNDNQSAVLGMVDRKADFAVVIGGYNSSNTSHLVELFEEKIDTYFINNEASILSDKEISHYLLDTKEVVVTENYLPEHRPLKVMVTSGASCPDALVEEVIIKLCHIVGVEADLDNYHINQ